MNTWTHEHMNTFRSEKLLRFEKEKNGKKYNLTSYPPAIRKDNSINPHDITYIMTIIKTKVLGCLMT